ncbi:MAG: hypothetical protein ACK4GO_16825 [Gemmobacter sp.]
MSKIVSITPKKQPRISDKVRKAISHMVRLGQSQTLAAEQVGLSRQGLNKALRRPEVVALVEQAQRSLVLEIEGLRGVARLAAIDAGLDLMLNSKDERIRVRMVEFFAAEPGKTPQIAVNVDARSIEAPATGYIYTRPDKPPEG